ncbi:MAG TPA: tryptophan synthase subunit beta, partial [Streptosporangiaceae bacterium]|nr:tryptophan synthase subunit beta [Streptosporangiaceae bacterium]
MTGTDPAEPEIAPVPDASGHFPAGGIAYGGRFAPEALTAALDELAVAYQQARSDPAFTAELDGLLQSYAGRPTLLTRAKRFGQQAG